MSSSVDKHSANDRDVASLEAASPSKGLGDDIEQAYLETDAHLGVKKVEATHRVYGKYSKWVLFIS